jgi:SAM-dependent methyltransferase
MERSTERLRSEIPEPPQDLVDVIGGGLEIGRGHLAQLRALAALRPHEHVLDVGCGVGRTAIALSSYLSRQGAYEGFDIWPEAIEWCQREITPRFPHFRFRQMDLFNAAYNPRGTVSASTFTFPYEDEQFDLAFLYSVFTHLLPADLERYLTEVRRVLKKGGRVLATFFLLNDDSLGRLASAPESVTSDGHNVARFLLERDFGGYRSGYDVPEWMVVYKEELVRAEYRKRGLLIKEPIFYGEWIEWATGASPSQVAQDTFLAFR